MNFRLFSSSDKFAAFGPRGRHVGIEEETTTTRRACALRQIDIAHLLDMQPHFPIPNPAPHTLSGIPEELRTERAWHLIAYGDQAPDRIPAHLGMPFEGALRLFNMQALRMGFIIPEDHLAIHLEGAYDYGSETLTFRAMQIINSLGSYVDIDEQAGSATVLVRAVLPVGFVAEAPRTAGLDFSRLRVLTPGWRIPLTGVSIDSTPCKIADAQVPVADLLVHLGMGEGGVR